MARAFLTTLCTTRAVTAQATGIPTLRPIITGRVKNVSFSEEDLGLFVGKAVASSVKLGRAVGRRFVTAANAEGSQEGAAVWASKGACVRPREGTVVGREEGLVEVGRNEG